MTNQHCELVMPVSVSGEAMPVVPFTVPSCAGAMLLFMCPVAGGNASPWMYSFLFWKR
nr:hypothetical protein Q903MT_gene5113 [Picea sitchensis]